MDEFSKENVFSGPEAVNQDSFVIGLLKGILGAVIGAVPGFLLWLLIAKLGYVSSICGIAIALGSIFGFAFFTKDNPALTKLGIVICLIVTVVTVFLAIRIDWALEISEYFEETMWPEFEAAMSSYGISSAESKTLYDEYMMEELGFSGASFANCFSNLDSIIEYFDMKSDYNMSLLKGGGFTLLGIIFVLAKCKK